MERLQLLLLDGFDRYFANARAARSFDQGGRISAIGLTAPDVRLHVVRGQQPHAVALGKDPPRPVVSTTAGFHDDLARRTVNKEASESRTAQPVPLNDRHSPSATASSKTFFARSTATVVA